MRGFPFVPLLLVACSGTTETTELNDVVEPSADRPEPETPEARRARLNREADLRAGIDPDQPFPEWNLTTAPPPEPDTTCVVGDLHHLEVVVGVAAPVRTAVVDLEQGPMQVALPDGLSTRHAALSVARLTVGATGDVLATACDGGTLRVSAGELADEQRWLLSRNKKDQLKLMDTLAADNPVRPQLRAVTRLERK